MPSSQAREEQRIDDGVRTQDDYPEHDVRPLTDADWVEHWQQIVLHKTSSVGRIAASRAK